MIFEKIVGDLNSEGKGTQSQPINGVSILIACQNASVHRHRALGGDTGSCCILHCFVYISMLYAPLCSYSLEDMKGTVSHSLP